MAVLNDNGIEIQKLEGVLRDLQDIARRKFAPLLKEGEVLSTDESSVLGRILGIVAESDSFNEELLLMLWQSLDPDQAEGVMLDKLFKLIRVYRKAAQEGVAGLMLRGDIGVTVPQGSSVGSPITGDRFVTTTDVTFSNTSVNGVVIDILDTSFDTVYKLSYVANDGMNIYPPITIKARDFETKAQIAQRFYEMIVNISSVLTASVDNDDRIHVQYTNPNRAGTFTVEPSMMILESYSPVNSYSATFSAVRQAANTLNIIQSPIMGWRDVYNPFDSIQSTPVESDTSLRLRAKFLKGSDSIGNRQAMYGDLISLDGVRYVGIKENIYDTELEGRGAHGVSIYVLGGDEDEIFRIIDSNIASGTMTDGDILRTMQDEAGTYDLSFSRVELVPIQIKLSLITNSSFKLDGYIKIQDAIVAHFENMKVGQDVSWSQLFTPINTVPNQSVNSLTIGIKGQELGQGNIEILPNQLPVISYEDIII